MITDGTGSERPGGHHADPALLVQELGCGKCGTCLLSCTLDGPRLDSRRWRVGGMGGAASGWNVNYPRFSRAAQRERSCRER